MTGNKKPPEGGKANQSCKANYTMHRHSLEAQRQRLLTALRQNPITTLEARQDLDIMHPGGRVMELRRQGYRIVTAWANQQGHRIGRYSLLTRQAAQGGGQ